MLKHSQFGILFVDLKFYLIYPDEREGNLEGAAEEGMRFHAALQDMVTWLELKKEAVVTLEPVSGQIDTLTQQKLENEVCTKNYRNTTFNFRCS